MIDALPTKEELAEFRRKVIVELDDVIARQAARIKELEESLAYHRAQHSHWQESALRYAEGEKAALARVREVEAALKDRRDYHNYLFHDGCAGGM